MKTSGWLGSILLLGNLALFVFFVVRFDALEIPNAIAYASLALSLAASVVHYLHARPDFRELFWSGYLIFMMLIATGHNINYLVSRDYQGKYLVTNMRPISGHRQAWRVQLDGNKTIKLIVAEPPAVDNPALNLRKGLFGVYFGGWRAETVRRRAGCGLPAPCGT